MKLTPHLISIAPSYINPVHDRVLILRSLKTEEIENLSVTNDLNETIDLTDNEIRVLGNFPKLNRLKTLLVAQNSINEIEETLFQSLPKLVHLNLSSNNISNLSQVITSLLKFNNIQTLILKDNPVCNDQNYRLYIIWKIPSLRVLDFAKVKQKEREEAKTLFENSNETIISETTLLSVPIINNEDKKLQKMVTKLKEDEIAALKAKLMNATNLDEIEMIENALKNGVL